MTEEEFIAGPSMGMAARGIAASREERARAYKAAEEMRNELLPSADPALRRVYDLSMEDAATGRDHPRQRDVRFVQSRRDH